MGISMTQILVVLLIVLLLFGAKKIPELMKGLGSGIKTFKKELSDDGESKEETKITKVEDKQEESVKSAQTAEQKQG